MKEVVVPAVFMFEPNLFQIFGPRNDLLFCPLIVLQSDIYYAMCDLVWSVIGSVIDREQRLPGYRNQSIIYYQSFI